MSDKKTLSLPPAEVERLAGVAYEAGWQRPWADLPEHVRRVYIAAVTALLADPAVGAAIWRAGAEAARDEIARVLNHRGPFPGAWVEPHDRPGPLPALTRRQWMSPDDYVTDNHPTPTPWSEGDERVVGELALQAWVDAVHRRDVVNEEFFVTLVRGAIRTAILAERARVAGDTMTAKNRSQFIAAGPGEEFVFVSHKSAWGCRPGDGNRKCSGVGKAAEMVLQEDGRLTAICHQCSRRVPVTRKKT